MHKFLVVLLIVGMTGFSLLGEVPIPPVTRTPPVPPWLTETELYFAAAWERSVYRLNLLTGDVSVVYTRPSGYLSSFTFHPYVPEKLYYVNANEEKIFRTRWLGDHWSEEEIVYEHTTYVRDIAFGPEPGAGTPSPTPRITLFFSEAFGAGGGKIFYFSGNTPILYYQVTVYWAGDFAFDEEGNLYISSGNIVPAVIYKVVNGVLHPIYQHSEPVMGFVVRGGKIYFANWGGAIYVLNLATGDVQKIFESAAFTSKWLSDVGFRH